MAMGRASGSRKDLAPSIESEMFKHEVKVEEDTARNWISRWGWMLEEYKALKSELDKITEKSVIVHKKEITDLRHTRPIPNSVNHEYGWLVAKPNFKLQVYGPDVQKWPLPD